VTFLELCQAYRSELGIPGTGPVTVLNQVGELAKLVRDIQNADLDVKRRWQDWRFLRSTHSTNVTAGSRVPEIPTPDSFNFWDETRFRLDPGTLNTFKISYIDYLEFEDRVDSSIAIDRTPEVVTVDNDDKLRLDPVPVVNHVLKGTYWRKAVQLENDSDISEIPIQFHRIIIVRAKIYYAEREDAPEITSGSVAEFEDLMFQMEANQLPNQQNRKLATAPVPGVVVAL